MCSSNGICASLKHACAVKNCGFVRSGRGGGERRGKGGEERREKCAVSKISLKSPVQP